MPTVPHQNADYLGSPEAIAEYLNAVLAEHDGDPRLLMMGLRTVAEAMGGISETARRTGLNRVSLSRALSGDRMPRIDTVMKIAHACGVQFRFAA